MTYEEALRLFRHYLCFLVPGRANGKSKLEYTRFESFCKAIEALEKQIPKKPYWEYGGCHCKSCGLDVLSDECFCPLCGQAIDWEVDE